MAKQALKKQKKQQTLKDKDYDLAKAIGSFEESKGINTAEGVKLFQYLVDNDLTESLVSWSAYNLNPYGEQDKKKLTKWSTYDRITYDLIDRGIIKSKRKDLTN